MLAQNSKMILPDLPVVDLERAREFYEGKLGFEPMEITEGGVLYRIGENSGFYIYQRGATKADHTEASFVVDDVEGEVGELRNKGVVFEEYDIPEMGIRTVNGISTFNGHQEAWFKDTEGNILSIGNG